MSTKPTLAPDIAGSAGIVLQHRVRSEELAESREHLDALDWNEPEWQRFFQRNPWIFGHGLDYRFLATEQAQANYGGADVTGRGGGHGLGALLPARRLRPNDRALAGMSPRAVDSAALIDPEVIA